MSRLAAPASRSPVRAEAGTSDRATRELPPRLAISRGSAVAVGYLAVAVVIWWRIWTSHPTSALTCGCGDPSLFVWSFGWMAHALAHGDNPFLSTAMFHPDGVNLLANTTAPLEAFLLAPVTWLSGPVAAVNVANTLAPAASAWATYWAVRRVLRTGVLGAFVAGLVVELSPVVVGGLAVSHLQIAMLAFVPVIWVCCHELLVRQSGSSWRWGLLLAAAVVGQFLTGTEVLAIGALFGVVAVVVAVGVLALDRVRGRGTGHRAVHAVQGLAVASAVATAALAYPTWFALAGPRHIAGAPWPGLMPFTGTSLSGIVTRHSTDGIAAMFRLSGYDGPVGQMSGYLGVGAVLVAAGAVVACRRRPVVWALAATAVAAAWLSLGSVWVGGSRPWWVPYLPWAALQHVPVLRNVLAQNFAILTLLAVSALVGLAVDRVVRTGRGLARGVSVLAAAALAAAALVPLATTWRLPLAVRTVDRPVWFTRDAPRLPPGSVVLAYPFVGVPGSGEAAVWQAMGGMHISLAGGFGLVPGRDGHADPGTAPGSATLVLAALTHDGYGPLPGIDDGEARAAVGAALAAWGVTTVVVLDRGRDPAYAQRWFTSLLQRPPTITDGAAVWSLSATARAHGPS